MTLHIAYDKHVGDLLALRVHSFLCCTLARIETKGKTQHKIRWGSHYPPLTQKLPPHSHNPSLNKTY